MDQEQNTNDEKVLTPTQILTAYENVLLGYMLGFGGPYYDGDVTAYNAWQTQRNALIAIIT